MQTLPETNKHSNWKWMVGRRLFPFGMASWQVRTVSFTECNICDFQNLPVIHLATKRDPTPGAPFQKVNKFSSKIPVAFIAEQKNPWEKCNLVFFLKGFSCPKRVVNVVEINTVVSWPLKIWTFNVLRQNQIHEVIKAHTFPPPVLRTPCFTRKKTASLLLMEEILHHLGCMKPYK